MVSKFVWQAYVFLRNVVRSVVISNALVERSIGDFLVALESFLPLRWLVRYAAPNPVVSKGNRLFYRPDEDLSVILPILFYGSYEPETTQVFGDLICPGMTVVNLGAHIGYYTLLAASLVGPSGRVYAFEPVPCTYELLIRNIRANRYDDIVIPVPSAVSNKSEQAKIFLAKKRSSVSAKLHTRNPKQPFMEVKAITLDEFFEGQGWPHVDLVKMDVEGAEKAALGGMKKLNEKNPKLKLILEFHLHNLDQVGVSPYDLTRLLLDYGYCRFRALWRHIGYLDMPKDLPRLIGLTRRANVNLLCEKR